MSKSELIEIAKDSISHAQAGTIRQTDSVAKVPAKNYYDQTHWELEMKQVFKRLPLMLAASTELPNPGDYKALTAAGTPVLITRNADGEIRAFLNSCSHRGAQIMLDGIGNAKRLTCPYHAWSFNHDGALTNIYAADDFGDIDKTCHGLVSLPVLEKAGLIWVHTNKDSSLDIEKFLSGYEAHLAHFGFENWYYLDSQRIEGPNWKIAYDGYLDFYHLPILHKDTFGNTFSNQALYYPFGPHQRVIAPMLMQSYLGDQKEEEWCEPFILNGVWTIFPHVSIASFNEDAQHGVLISQLFPGDHPGESYTIQTYLLAKEPNEEEKQAAREQFDFLKYVVVEEDYATGLRQQQALKTGLREHVLFGRNEEGGQRFHEWLEKIIHTEDDALSDLF